MAAISTAAKHTAHYVEESAYGTTPATPTWTPLPITADSINLTKDAIESQKLRADRQVEDLRHGNKQVGGDVPGELEYGSFDDMLEAGMMGSWSTDVLKAGTTRRSFTFEKYYDLDTDEYHRATGCEVNTMAVSIQPNAMPTITLGLIGKDLTTNTAQVASSTYSAATDSIPFDSFTGTITEGGTSTGTCTGLDFTLENNIEPAWILMSDTTLQGAEGKSRVTGTASHYFTSKDLYDKFINETESEIVITLQDPDGNTLQFDFPRIKYTGGNPEVSGEGPVTVSLEFTALYNAADASQLIITRAAV